MAGLGTTSGLAFVCVCVFVLEQGLFAAFKFAFNLYAALPKSVRAPSWNEKTVPSGSFLTDSCCWVHRPWRSLSVMKKLESLELKFTGLFVNLAMATPCLIAFNFCMTSSWWPTLAQTISSSRTLATPSWAKRLLTCKFCCNRATLFQYAFKYILVDVLIFCNFTTFYVYFLYIVKMVFLTCKA